MRSIFLLVVLMVIPLGDTVSASEWESIGPMGGNVHRYDRIDQTLWASTLSGVFRSDDAGRTWRRSGKLGQFMTTWGVIKAFGTHYLATNTGVWKSDDGWEWRSALDSGVTLNAVRNVELHQGRLFASTWIGTIYQSLDSGATWQSTNPDSAGAFVEDLFSIDTTLFIATQQGVFRSTDGGRTIRKQFSGTSYGFTLDDGILISWSDPARLSRDSGRTWQTLPIPEASSASRTDNGTWFISTIYGNGLWRSKDQGATWTKLNTTTLGQTFPSAIAVGNAVIINPFEMGCYRSTDDGETWTRSSIDISAANVYDITSALGTLYVGCDNIGLFTSKDEGSSWVNTFQGRRVVSLTAREHRVMLGYDTPGVVALSTDSGERYNAIKRLTNQYEFIEGVFLDHTDLYVASMRGLARSTDNGSTWIGASNGLPDAIVDCMTFTPSTIYCGTNTAQHNRYGGVFRSTDRGANWEACSLAIVTSDDVWSLTSIDPIIIAGTSRGIHRSTDDGLTWTKVANFTAKSFTQHRGVIFGATTFGLIHSTDQGATWSFDQPYLPDALVRSVAALGDYVYLGLESGGVLKRRVDFVPLSVSDQRYETPAPFQIVPNPVDHGSFRIEGTDLEGAQVYVVDLMGSVVDVHPAGASATIDVSALGSGVYVCVLERGSGYRQTRLLVLE